MPPNAPYPNQIKHLWDMLNKSDPCKPKTQRIQCKCPGANSTGHPHSPIHSRVSMYCYMYLLQYIPWAFYHSITDCLLLNLATLVKTTSAVQLDLPTLKQPKCTYELKSCTVTSSIGLLWDCLFHGGEHTCTVGTLNP